ncbi:calcium uptake protein, mitochondrial-like [Momordica charantia]|uniref:Calcium uptake protein, mitochondrial-like n=1 Tax=Momordica charantia TaxID=3673 RepID=A0A6J1CPF9_MOMCH|nr:calcium uptake protein, mitochondrial-like [Momordica charantia]
MFSSTLLVSKSSASIHRVVTSQRLTVRLFNNQLGGSASTSPSSSLLASSHNTGSGEESKRSSIFDFLVKSVSSGVVAVGIGSLLCLNSSTSNSNVSFADFQKETKWTMKEDQFQYPFPNQNARKKSKFLFGDDYRRRVFFNYEKRIRIQSPPEKVFEYFASVHTPEGEIFMTPADLMRAIVPVFPPSESNRVREGFLRGERIHGELYCVPSEFFMLFDINSDGLISFAEYIFFVTLLSIPESSFSVAFKMFDIDNNGEIDREEFKKVMALMRKQNRQGARHRDGRRLGMKVCVENGGLVEYFFGQDGKGSLHHDKFVQFLRQLHDEILRLEFSHYDFKSQGSISAKDFALSMVASADINHIDKLLDRVEALNKEPQFRNIRITYEEFKDFAELRKKLESFSLAIFSYGKVNGELTKQDFQRAASHVCGVSITRNVVDIIFHIFDANGDGDLSSDEFVRVIQRKEVSSSQAAVGAGGFLSCWFSCSAKCSSAKLFVRSK